MASKAKVWRGRLAACRASGLSTAAFCREHGLAYPQYACRRCETIVAEPVAPAILDGGMAAPSLLAQVAIQKYQDHLPLYRQEAIFARHGIELKRTTLAEWIGVIGVRLQPLVDRLREKLLASPVLHADEIYQGVSGG